MTIQKRTNINIASDLGTCPKYVVQFTDSTPKNYWYAKKVKVTFSNMSILNKIQ